MVVQTLPWAVEVIDDDENWDENVESLVIFQSFEMAITALEVLHHLHMYAEIFNMVFAQKCADECGKIIESNFVDDDLKRVAARFLTAVPACLLPLCPKIPDSEASNAIISYENYEMKFVAAVLKYLSKKLEDTDPVEIRLLTSFFVVLILLCTKHKQVRRYCRSKLIPSNNPAALDKELRYKIIKLILTAKNFCAKQAAEFLFILCKRSVSKLIKDTGVKHVAELLPDNKDIYRKREGDSEDSDDENKKPKKVEPETKKEIPKKPAKSVSKLAPREAKTEETKTKKIPKSEIVPEMVRKYSSKI
uniref:Condensin complex subunit 1 C-terminal domain-containing protein n=1 Tax=Panagrolaimus sp. ES5 TaxID=591445 RepID=A0AC34G8K2_9BILA